MMRHLRHIFSYPSPSCCMCRYIYSPDRSDDYTYYIVGIFLLMLVGIVYR